MQNYPISPEDCLIVRAIHLSSSLRDAAVALNCDPGGLFRKVKRISEDHDLLCKMNGKWTLTNKGQALLTWTEESIQSQKVVIESKTSLRIATTMWFSEQALLPHLQSFRSRLPELKQVQIHVPEESFEKALKSGSVDLVVVCHAPFDPAVAYKKVGEEEWIVIAPVAYQKQITKKSVKQVSEFLAAQPFIQHNQINPNSVLPLEIEQAPGLTLDHFIGVRAAVVNGLGWSVVPRILVSSALKAKELFEVPQLKPTIENQVCIWWLRDRADLKKIVSVLCEELLKKAL